jgi:hypothetical protein
MTRKAALTSSSAVALRAPLPQRPNVVAWINAVLRNPETGQPFELLPAEIAFLEHAFELEADGSARYPELVYSAPKKSGKTAWAAILTLVIVLLFGGNDPEGIVAANDLEQSSTRVFSAIKKIVKASPKLRKSAKIAKNIITFPDLGATITAIASEFAGAAGSNSTVSTFDELWGYTTESSRRLWDELVPPPTRKAAWRLTVTYAGFAGESVLLQELYDRGTAQPLVGTDLHAGDGILCFWTHSPVAPWQTPRWYAQMRQQMRPNQFARMIENRWVTSEASFIDMAVWDACVDRDLKPIESDRNLPVYIGVDASLKRDSTAIVAVATDGERVKLVTHRVFQPSPDQPLDFEATIEATIIDLCSRFSLQAIKYDPWQMASVSQRLLRLGAPMTEFAQTSGNLTDSTSNLYELIKAQNLSVYADADMRLSISQAVAVETPRGWRIAKEKAKHKIDVVVALGMACHGAVKQKLVPGWGMLEWTRRAADAAVAGQNTPPTLQQEHGDQAVMQIGSRRPTNFVKVIVPGEPSHLYGMSGTVYIVEIEDGQRVAWMSLKDAYAAISSILSLDFFELNAELRRTLGGVKPPPSPGIRVTDMMQAIEDSRPVNFSNKGAITRQSLAMLRRAR